MIPEVVSEGNAAVRTFEGETAIRTQNEIGISSSIEKEETLFLVFNIFLERCLYFFRKHAPFPLHVHNLHLGKGLSSNPLWKPEEAEFSFLRIIERFQGRGGSSQKECRLILFRPDHSQIPGMIF